QYVRSRRARSALRGGRGPRRGRAPRDRPRAVRRRPARRCARRLCLEPWRARSMKLSLTPLTLRTKHEFKIARGGNSSWEHLVLTLEHEGKIGLGEVAATAYYGENASTARAALAAWEPLLPT